MLPRFHSMVCLSALLTLLLGGAAMLRGGEESEAERRERLQALTAEQKEQLQRKKERFDSLSVDEQNALRDLQESLSATEDSDTLLSVLKRYNEWLRMLPSAQRAELLSLPADERIQKIKGIQKQQERDRFRQYVGQLAAELPEQDRDAIFEWLQKYIGEREDEIYGRMSPDSRGRFEKIGDLTARRRALIASLIWRRQFPMPGPEEIEDVIPQLSAESQNHLKNVKTPEEKDRLARAWIMATIFSKAIPQPSDEERGRIFANLPPNERERLEKLEPEQMRRELNRMHHAEQFRKTREGGWRGPGWGPPGGFGRGKGSETSRGGADDGPRFDGRGDRPPPGRFPDSKSRETGDRF